MEPPRRLGFPRDVVRLVLRKHPSSPLRIAEICRVLNLEFYVEPPNQNQVRDPAKVVADVNRRLTVGHGASPWVTNLRTDIREDTSATKHKRISRRCATNRHCGAGCGQKRWYGCRVEEEDRLDVVSPQLAGPAQSRPNTVRDYWYLQRINRTNTAGRLLDPVRARPMSVPGRPDLRPPHERQSGYKTSQKNGDNNRVPVSDHPAWELVRRPNDAETLDTVIWMTQVAP